MKPEGFLLHIRIYIYIYIYIYTRIYTYIHTCTWWWPKWFERYNFHQQNNGFKSIISIFCCSAIIQWDFSLHEQPVLHTEIWSHHLPVCLEWHEETEQTETDYIQKNCGNVSKMLQETCPQSCLEMQTNISWHPQQRITDLKPVFSWWKY